MTKCGDEGITKLKMRKLNYYRFVNGPAPQKCREIYGHNVLNDSQNRISSWQRTEGKTPFIWASLGPKIRVIDCIGRP